MTTPNEPAPGATAQPETAPGAPPPTPPAPGAPAGPVDINTLPAQVQDYIKQLRDEAGSSRTRAKASAAEQARAEVLQQISRAIGLTEDVTDPEVLGEQLAATQLAEAGARLELDVFRTAVRLGVDADRLLDSRRFAEEVDALPAENFDQHLQTLITTWATRDPSLRAGGAAATPGRPVEALRSGALPAGEPATVDPNEWMRRRASRS